MNPRVAFGVLTLVATSACTPDNAAEQMRLREIERCRNAICLTDQVPRHDDATEVVFKVDGRWYVAPKNYWKGDLGAAFFWPSKTPGNTVSHEFPEYSALPAGRAADVEVQIFLHAPRAEQGEETYERHLKSAIGESRIDTAFGVERTPTKSGTLIVARGRSTPSGRPAAVLCLAGQPDVACGSSFLWKDGQWVYVRFSAHLADDWPAIFDESIKVLNLLRVAQP